MTRIFPAWEVAITTKKYIYKGLKRSATSTAEHACRQCSDWKGRLRFFISSPLFVFVCLFSLLSLDAPLPLPAPLWSQDEKKCCGCWHGAHTGRLAEVCFSLRCHGFFFFSRSSWGEGRGKRREEEKKVIQLKPTNYTSLKSMLYSLDWNMVLIFQSFALQGQQVWGSEDVASSQTATACILFIKPVVSVYDENWHCKL